MKMMVSAPSDNDGRSFVPVTLESLAGQVQPGQYVQRAVLPSGFSESFDPNWVAPEYVPSPVMVDAPAASSVKAVVPVITADDFRRRQRYAESGFNDRAVSKAGAKGAYQIMPSVLNDYVAATGKKGDLFDYEYNQAVRDWYVDWLMKRPVVNGNGNTQSDVNTWAKMAAAYNWGVGNLTKYLQKLKDKGEDIYNSTDWIEGLNPETRDYVKFIALQQDTTGPRTTEAFNKAMAKYNIASDGGRIRTLADKLIERGYYCSGGKISVKKYDGGGELPGFIRRDDATGNYVTAIPRNDKSGRKMLRQWERGDGRQLMRDSSLVRTVNPEDNRYMYVKRKDWLSSGGMEDKNSDEFTSRLKFIGFDGDFYNYYDPETGNIELYDNRFFSGGNLYWPGGSLSPVNRKVFTHGMGNAVRRLIPKRIVESVNEAASSHSNEKYAAKDFFDTTVTKEGREYLKDITDSDFKDVGRGFLLDDSRQRQFMESLGYHLVDDMNYGMVNKATNNLMQKTGKPRIPIYQLGEDDIDPSLVTLVSTDPKVVSHYHVPYDRQLNHANSYPSALYADADGNHYVKSWDLNDYGQHNGNLADSFVNWVSGYSGSNKDSSGSTYGKNQFLAEMYDLVGNPFVQRTGLVKVDEPDVVDKKQEERLKAALDALSDLTTSKSDYRSGGTLLRPYNKFEMGGPEGDGVDKNTTIQKDNTSVHIPLKGLLENSTLNWDAKSWLGERAENDRGQKYTDEDVRIFESHVPEYRQIEQKAKMDGTWLKMPDGSTWRGDPRDWVVMQSEAFRNNYSPNPWWTGQKRYVKDPDTGSTGVSRARYYDGTLWFSDNPDYAKTFSDALAENDKDPRRDTVTGHVFLAGVPNNVNVMDVSGPANSTADMWYDMPYGRDSSGNIVRLPDEEIIRRQMPVPKIHFDSFPLDIAKRIRFKRNKYNEIDRNVTSRPMKQKVVTDSLVDWASKLGAPGIYLHSVDDGPLTPQRAVYDPEYGGTIGGQMYDGVVDELITLPGLTPRIKFIHGNNGDFDPSKEDKYSSVGVSPRGGLS